MSTSSTVIGSYEGEDVYQVRLRSDGGIEAGIVTFGAALRDLQVVAPEGKRHVVLGYPSFEDQLTNKAWHFGAVPGRVANRIAHGQFTLEGAQYQINLNENDRHVCHGGTSGFGVRNWTIKEQSPNTVTLTLRSADGDQGFPGNLLAQVTYALTDDSTLQIDWSATTDQSTIVNLTTHAYFNLDGTSGQDTTKHILQFDADHYTPVDESLIPTGELKSVENTPFDFRQPRPIGDSYHYDHNIVLRDLTGEVKRAATLMSSQSDLKMELWTDQPGVQFFDGKPLDVEQPGHDGMRISSRAGICLEPQVHPDAINQKNFPNTVLKPGETYRHHSELRFSQV
ncbi:hypothetical protein IAR55_001350 [Kwoniella newhampshirensis]|uniref:Aldose 1-epimerase n=1 Tax=Kwoniella newhampshirensis TaxID=1651941 RepID=A0AAW0Z5F5_9TREE